MPISVKLAYKACFSTQDSLDDPVSLQKRLTVDP